MITTINFIEAIDRAHLEGIDTWEMLVSLGASDEEEMGIRRWRHGDLALRVEKHYGDKALARYASAIGVKYPTLKQRHGMSKYYEPDTRYLFENLFYTHYREAMRLPDIERSLKALSKASRRDWPVFKLQQFVDRCTGKHKVQPPMEGEITRKYKQDDGYYAVVRMSSDYGLQTGQMVILKAKQEA